jgi:hypothetical protein
MTSMAGLPFAESMPKFKAGVSAPFHLYNPCTHRLGQIAHQGGPQPDHQFILKPVTGEGRVSSLVVQSLL